MNASSRAVANGEIARRFRRIVASLAATLWIAVSASTTAARAFDDPPPDEDRRTFEAARKLGRGVNLGNALEAPREGEWGLTLEEDHFRLIRQAGFDTVRLPIKWSAHTSAEQPYAIEPAFAERVDWAIRKAIEYRLNIVINVHHYDEIVRDPDVHGPRLMGIWALLAQRYRASPNTVYFELLNEPHDKLDAERWNKLLPSLLTIVRVYDPRRYIIVGPDRWNAADRMETLELPPEDRRLIGTFHYYSPFEFTHQGAEWAEGSGKWLGRKWAGTPAELDAIRADFDKVAAWSKREGRPVLLGEFGAYGRADLDSRAKWTAAVAREAEARGFAWAYWEFGAGFGVYDREAKAWREPLLKALIPNGPGR